MLPGLVRQRLPEQVDSGEQSLEQLIPHLETIINCSKNWQHPLFFGYFAMVTTYPTVLASLFHDALMPPATTWHSNPSAVELENLVIEQII